MKREDVLIIKVIFAVVSIMMNIIIAPFISVYIIFKSKPVYDHRKGYSMYMTSNSSGLSGLKGKRFYIYDWQVLLIKYILSLGIIMAVAIFCMYAFSPIFIG